MTAIIVVLCVVVALIVAGVLTGNIKLKILRPCPWCGAAPCDHSHRMCPPKEDEKN